MTHDVEEPKRLRAEEINQLRDTIADLYIERDTLADQLSAAKSIIITQEHDIANNLDQLAAAKVRFDQDARQIDEAWVEIKRLRDELAVVKDELYETNAKLYLAKEAWYDCEAQLAAAKAEIARYKETADNWLEFERQAEARGIERAAKVADSVMEARAKGNLFVEPGYAIRVLNEKPNG